VAVKWFSPDESGYRDALALLGDHEERRLALAAPSLLKLEVLNALRLRPGFGSADLVEVAKLLEDFQIEWFDAATGLAADAATIAAETGLTVYDALFVALARELDADLATDDAQIIASRACRIRALG
jgi:predicted nucleic acid-binding protein